MIIYLEWWVKNFNGDFFSASILKQLGKTNSQSNIFTARSSVFTAQEPENLTL